MDIAALILEEHAQQRRLFAQIDEIGPDPDALGPIWKRLRALLDSHALAEEKFLYPTVLKVGRGANDADSADEETEDAIKDHNEIRDTAAAVDEHELGSGAWFEAVGKANEANSDHMAEEERQALTDIRRNLGIEERHKLGVKFATFEADNLLGVTPVDRDPKKWVREHKG